MWKFRWWLADRIERFSHVMVEVLRYSRENRRITNLMRTHYMDDAMKPLVDDFAKVWDDNVADLHEN